MILNLTHLSNISLQEQIYQQIRSMILSGDLQTNSLLPSIRKLARDGKVSVITVQRAYELLEKEGLIISHRGKGFFVNKLDTRKKKMLVKKRIIEKIEPAINTAINEGIEKKELMEIIKKILDEA